MRVAGAILVLSWLQIASSPGVNASTVFQAAGITRHHEGDTFLLRRDGNAVTCSRTLCADSRAIPSVSGTEAAPQCGCRCPSELPVFREDLHVCVDDIHECTLATFKNGAKLQKVPFVFLPMKGQIIHPSSDIVFTEGVGGEEPVCVVSSAQFLTRNGWLELRNTSDTEPPLRLFRDHRRTFLQWLGEQDLRLGMEGRILLARLMCKDPSSHGTDQHLGHTFSTPCVAFRVAGSQGAREVMFTGDYSLAGSGGLLHNLLGVGGSDHRNSGGLSTSEGVAVGICVLLLGLVYAASVCVYVHVRRKRRKRKKRTANGDFDSNSSDSERGAGGLHVGLSGTDLNLLGEGVIKNNPLLMGGRDAFSMRGLGNSSGYLNGSRRSLRGDICAPNEGIGGGSDEEEANSGANSDLSARSEDRTHNQYGMKVSSTKAVVHPESSRGPAPPPPPPLEGLLNARKGGSSTSSSGSSTSSGIYTLTLQPAGEGGSMERHPEESVSIVETLDEEASFSRTRDFSFFGGRHGANLGINAADAFSGSRGSCSGSSTSMDTNPFLAAPGTATRRKLYFNPAYFEPELLHSPPAAALEFLAKLREVITMSKHKMIAKRFTPSLNGIPEERDSMSGISERVNHTGKTKNSCTGSTSRKRAPSSPPPKPPVSVLPDVEDVSGSKQQSIQRWLQDLESGDPIEEEQIEIEKSAEIKSEKIEAKPKMDDIPPIPPGPKGVPPPKKLMDAVIKELVRERGLTPAHDTTSDDTNQSEKRTSESTVDDNEYETITMAADSNTPPTTSSPGSPTSRPALMMYGLPELLAKTTGYNLVSEVYVNDGYSCSSNQSSASRNSAKKNPPRTRPVPGSTGSSPESSSPSHSFSESPDDSLPIEDPNDSMYPGRLTIKLKDTPHHRERKGYESDEFEPDTLDRGKRHSQPERQVKKREDVCLDSLERPMKILLKSSGSFFKDATSNENISNRRPWAPTNDIWAYAEMKENKKKRSPSSIADLRSTNILYLPGLENSKNNKAFGSLREIFEAKRQQQLQKQLEEMENIWRPHHHDLPQRRTTTRSLIEPNELRWRSGLSQKTVDEIRELMWSSTPEASVPLPRVSPNKPKRQRSADLTASPPTPPPPVPPSANIPPSLPPKQRKNIVHNNLHLHHQQKQQPPTPSRDNKPPPSLPPKNGRGSRSPMTENNNNNRNLPNLVTSHKVPPTGASAASDHEDDSEEDEQGGSCTLGRKVETCIDNAFSTWGKKQNQRQWGNDNKAVQRPGDSGYLSSDSNNSLKQEANSSPVKDESSETEESLCDGESESGAESIGTDSFFFGRTRQDNPMRISPPVSGNFNDVTPGTTVIQMQALPTVHIQAAKKRPPPPPKRISSKLETRVAPPRNDRNISAQYAL